MLGNWLSPELLKGAGVMSRIDGHVCMVLESDRDKGALLTTQHSSGKAGSEGKKGVLFTLQPWFVYQKNRVLAFCSLPMSTLLDPLSL